jgi:hypothetical protein
MKLGWLAGFAASVVIGLPVGIVLLLGGDTPCDGGSTGPAPSAAAANGIPGNYLALYQAAGQRYGIPWNLIAAIGSIETDHGRSTLPGVSSGENSAGAGGPMQFIQSTFDQYGVDGNNDGTTSRYDPRDAIPSAANYLKASGAPGDLHRAIFAYNHSEAYVQSVLATMREYAGSAPRVSSTATTTTATTTTSTTSTTPDASAGIPTGGCADLGGLTVGTGNSSFTIDANANAPGRPLSPTLTEFIGHMATFYDGELVVTTGTNHDQYTTTGNVSDHYTGNGADFGMVLNHGTNDGPVGDAIAASAFLAAGLPRDIAISRARAGGAQTIVSNGLRIQIIWKSDVGGNHHNHVHVGVGSA